MGAHLAALVALWQSAIAIGWQLLGSCLLLLLAWLAWRAANQHSPLVVKEQIGRWWLEMPQKQGAAELTAYRVWRYLVVMDFRGWDDAGRKWQTRIVVWPDSVSSETFRRLRVRLRYGIHLIGNAEDF